MSSAQPAKYEDLPRSYHIFKWRILLAFAFFYLFLYMGRFNFWPVAPLVKEDLSLSNFEIGLVNALLLWGFGLGDLIDINASTDEELEAIAKARIPA